jgi:hypothetical protein
MLLVCLSIFLAAFAYSFAHFACRWLRRQNLKRIRQLQRELREREFQAELSWKRFQASQLELNLKKAAQIKARQLYDQALDEEYLTTTNLHVGLVETEHQLILKSAPDWLTEYSGFQHDEHLKRACAKYGDLIPRWLASRRELVRLARIRRISYYTHSVLTLVPPRTIKDNENAA